jgi:hypothetical protein
MYSKSDMLSDASHSNFSQLIFFVPQSARRRITRPAALEYLLICYSIFGAGRAGSALGARLGSSLLSPSCFEDPAVLIWHYGSPPGSVAFSSTSTASSTRTASGRQITLWLCSHRCSGAPEADPGLGKVPDLCRTLLDRNTTDKEGVHVQVEHHASSSPLPHKNLLSLQSCG